MFKSVHYCSILFNSVPYCTGCFFYWSALKMTEVKCQTLRKFWHFLNSDLLCNLTLSHFLGRSSKKHPMKSSVWLRVVFDKVCELLPKRRQLWAKGQNMAKHFFVGTFHVGHISDRTSAFDLKFYLTDICLICLTWPSCWSLMLKVNLLVKRGSKTLFQKKKDLKRR